MRVSHRNPPEQMANTVCSHRKLTEKRAITADNEQCSLSKVRDWWTPFAKSPEYPVDCFSLNAQASDLYSAYLARNLDDTLVHGSDNSFLRWAATRHTRRIAITFESIYQVTSSNCEHVDQSRNGSTWNFDWLFKAQQYKRCKFVRLFTKSLCGISHMCDGFYGSEIDVNGNDDKKKSRIKTDPANIREREGVSGRERERSHRDFFHMPPHFKKQVPSIPYPGSHRIRMFLSL
ncbi:hypothetical protein G5I_13179 [Acromyrmex echinatior]|uniref:Uncharacterized protein n=1 Tax=Acromyrmex echinatior TaxID=103372 RepID=F4X4B9_ACREC|nr:hypothetical protein G5I_13179 [Acromyrmex echinatior]